MTTTMQTDEQAEMTSIEMMIGNYIKAVDTADVVSAQQHLHPDFRVVAANASAPGECRIISRELYIELLATGKIGGQKREVVVQFLHLNGFTAMAFVRIWNKDQLFLTYYNLIKKEERWLIIADMPTLAIN